LAFKPRTDDMREAPSISLIDFLLQNHASITAYDPVAISQARSIFGERIEYAKRNYDCLKEADALILVTEWDEFRRPNWDMIHSIMRERILFDGRNIWNPERLRALGFTYYGIGR